MWRWFPCKAYAVLLIVFAALFVISLAQADDVIAGDMQPMPAIQWQDADGNTHQLNDTQGKPRILHFWAAWCIPCREEMPEMLQWRQDNPDIEVIALSLDQRIAQTKHFIRKNKLDMPALLLIEDADVFSVPVVPYTLFISEDGLLVGYYPGIAPWNVSGFTESVRSLFRGNDDS